MGVGLFQRARPVLDCGLLSFCVWAYPCLSKLSVFVKLRRGLCLAGCHVVVQTQCYHLVYILGSLLKFQGVGVVLTFDVFLHCYAFFCDFCAI